MEVIIAEGFDVDALIQTMQASYQSRQITMASKKNKEEAESDRYECCGFKECLDCVVKNRDSDIQSTVIELDRMHSETRERFDQTQRDAMDLLNKGKHISRSTKHDNDCLWAYSLGLECGYRHVKLYVEDLKSRRFYHFLWDPKGLGEKSV